MYIGEILKRFDVVAIQEILSHTTALRLMLEWMNHGQPGRYNVLVSDVARGDDGDNERLGFLLIDWQLTERWSVFVSYRLADRSDARASARSQNVNACNAEAVTAGAAEAP